MVAEQWRLEKAKMKGIQEPHDFSPSRRVATFGDWRGINALKGVMKN
jgi:hypothetical protein